jgi:single stranded DNA-binding protein (ssb)
MANDLNSFSFTGRVIRDPEVKTTQGGTVIATYSVAVNGSKKVDKVYESDVMFLDIKTFGNMATTVQQYVFKGTKVAIIGRLTIEKWEVDGQQRNKAVIITDKIVFLSKGSDKNDHSADIPQENSDLEPF